MPEHLLPHPVEPWIIGRDIRPGIHLGGPEEHRRVAQAKQQLLQRGDAFGLRLHRFSMAEAAGVAGIDIQIDVSVAGARQVTNAIMLPGVTMTAANKPGAILRGGPAKSGERRRNKLPALPATFAV